MLRSALFCALTALWLAFPAAAQNGTNQFCVRAFEDHNANQVRDAGEPFLATGIGADLMNADGVIIASLLLGESSTAAQGIACFERLDAGVYTIRVTSAEYTATTPDSMTASLVTGELPAVLEFGAQSINAVVPEAPPETNTAPDWSRLAAAALGAFVALVIMQLFGAIIYFFRFRRRKAPPPVEFDTSKFRRPID